MSQVVIYKGITVQAVDRAGDKILVRTSKMGDAQKVSMPFKEMNGTTAIFETWVPESELVAVS